jgi:ribosome-binding protein aMBF1 (putative translation factor)
MEWVIGIIVVVVILSIIGALAGPGSCDVCGQGIKKKYYTWQIDGKKQKLCPKCNTQMERKISKEAFKKKFG